MPRLYRFNESRAWLSKQAKASRDRDDRCLGGITMQIELAHVWHFADMARYARCEVGSSARRATSEPAARLVGQMASPRARPAASSVEADGLPPSQP